MRSRALRARARAVLGELALALATPRELDRRLRAATGFLQSVDLEIGRLLKQVLDRRLYGELGLPSFERFVTERLDLAESTARRLVRMARAEHTRGARSAPIATRAAASSRSGERPRAPQSPSSDRTSPPRGNPGGTNRPSPTSRS